MSPPISFTRFLQHPIDTIGQLYGEAREEAAELLDSEAASPHPRRVPPPPVVSVSEPMALTPIERAQACHDRLADEIFQTCSAAATGKLPPEFSAGMEGVCTDLFNETFGPGGVCAGGMSVVTYLRAEHRAQSESSGRGIRVYSDSSSHR